MPSSYQTPRVDRSAWTFPPPESIRNTSGPLRPATLPMGRLFSHNGVVIDSANRLRADLSPDFRPPPSGHRLLDYPGLPAPVEINDHIFSLPTPASWKNYYHWLIDALPRVRHADLTEFGRVATPLCRPYHAEALDRLGVSQARRLELKANSHLRCAKLTAATPLPLGQITASDVQWLRGLFGVHPRTPSRRLYISRADAWRRRIRNERKLLELLAPHGFEAIAIGTRSIREQAEIFSEAELIIAPHGAALTNLLFAPPTCRLLELFASNYHYPQFKLLSRTLGLSHFSHVSPTAEDDPDCDVELSTLRPLLNSFLVTP